jgi:hypothetical protein
MGIFKYYMPNIKKVYLMELGAMNSNALTDQNGGGKLNVLHFKDCYKHNF